MANRKGIFRTGPLETGRVEAFSDGVVAVVVTLLVLEIKIPPGLRSETELWSAIVHLLPTLGAWVVSFAFVMVFWVNHHHFFSTLKHADRGLLWLNGLFLLTIALVPFPTALVGEYPGTTPPLALLSAVMLATSLSFLVMRFYVSFDARLLKQNPTATQMRRAMLVSAVAPTLYSTAIAMSFYWPPGAIIIQILVPVIFFFKSPSDHYEASVD